VANKILVARGTKARIEEIKSTLAVNELVYSTDTGELGVKKANGNIEYFMNAADIDASKQDKLIAGDNISIVGNTISASVAWQDVENKPELYNKAEINSMLDNKVDKVTGKALSTNDYTNTDKQSVEKIPTIEQGILDLESDKADKSELFSGDYNDLTNKPIIPTQPTKVSELVNDSGFATESYVDNKVASVYKYKGSVSTYNNLPTTNRIVGDVYDVQDTGMNYAWNGSDWDSLGIVIDLSNYYQKNETFTQNEINSMLDDKVDKVSGKGLSTNDLTNTLKTNYDTAYGWGNHAVEGYLKSITKAMVEGVLTGTITSHNHDGVYEPANSNIQSHISSTSNPHSVTKTDVGLGNVDNTSDLSKPISTATQTALSNKVDKVSGKGLSTNDFTTTEKNKLSGIQAGAQVNAVTTVAGRTGAVVLAKADVGLGSVQNYGISSQAQAIAGTVNTVYMTPLRTKEAITAAMGDIESALDAILGV